MIDAQTKDFDSCRDEQQILKSKFIDFQAFFLIRIFLTHFFFFLQKYGANLV